MTPARIATLFARRDALAAKLAQVDRQIDEACRDYSDSKGYRVTLRRESVRAEIGGLS